MKVGCVQYAPEFGEKQKNLKRVAALLAGQGPLDLLVLPELFATGYAFSSPDQARALAEPIPEGETSRALAPLARRMGALVVGGIAETAGDRLFNSAAVFGPAGHLGTYRKVHLFDEEVRWFAPGDLGFPVWDAPWGRLGVMVCYDWQFPEACRTLALAGAEVIAHPSNLVRRKCHLAMPARAIENRVFAFTADRTGQDPRPGREPLDFPGQSRGYDPEGEELFQMAPGEERLAVVEIDPSRARDKRLNSRNDILADRRTDQYRL